MEERATFPVGGITLEGLLSIPATSPQMGVVVCHPHPLYGGEMHNNIVSALVDAFQAAGLATLRFNFRGVGNSEGAHDDGNGEVEDVKAAVTYLLSRQTISTVVVAGYSFGSMVGLRAGADDDRVHKLIGVALPIGMRDASFLHNVKKAKLLISGDHDNYSPVPGLRDLVTKMPDPKSLVIVDGADHFFWGTESKVAKAAVEFLENK